MDLGARGDQTEFHVTFTGADNSFGAAAATPIQMLAQDWSSIYTVPQTTENQLAFLTASAQLEADRYLDLSGELLLSQFQPGPRRRQRHRRRQQPGDRPNPVLICFPNLDGTVVEPEDDRGQTVPNDRFPRHRSVLGEIDRTWTTTNSFGGSVQAASSEKSCSVTTTTSSSA